jgi:two-component system, cell cycle sensor histidine kinase and response regulator CckA
VAAASSPRLAVSKMLRRRGLHVLEAANGRSAIDLFRAGAPDVVLLDMTLPGMSGREILQELTRIQPDVKVIVTSAYTEDYAMATIGVRQPWFYVRKPYSFSELMELLRQVRWGTYSTTSP